MAGYGQGRRVRHDHRSGRPADRDADIVVIPGAAAVASADDCIDYDPGVLKVGRAGAAGWAVTDGHTPLLTLDTKSDAQRGLALVQRYRRHCFLGRSNTHPNRSDYVIEYWEQPTHAPTVIQPERCTPYDRRALKLVDAMSAGSSCSPAALGC